MAWFSRQDLQPFIVNDAGRPVWALALLQEAQRVIWGGLSWVHSITHLHKYRFQRLRREVREHLVDSLVNGESVASCGAVSWEDVQNPWRNAGFQSKLTNPEGWERGLLCDLDNYCVACEQNHFLRWMQKTDLSLCNNILFWCAKAWKNLHKIPEFVRSLVQRARWSTAWPLINTLQCGTWGLPLRSAAQLSRTLFYVWYKDRKDWYTGKIPMALTCSQRWSNLPCQHQDWEIPGNDLTNNSCRVNGFLEICSNSWKSA